MLQINRNTFFFLQTKIQFHYQLNNLALFEKAIAIPIREMLNITVIKRPRAPTALPF